MKTLPKLALWLLLGTALASACRRQHPLPPAADRAPAPGLWTAPAPAPWEPVDKQFTGCAGS